MTDSHMDRLNWNLRNRGINYRPAAPADDLTGPGSVKSYSRPGSSPSRFCRIPLGQTISTLSILVRSPRPKWTVFEDCDRYPLAERTSRVITAFPEYSLTRAPMASWLLLVPCSRMAT